MAKKATKKSVKKVKKKLEENESGGKDIDFGDIFGKAIENVAKKSGKNVTEFDANLRSALVGVPLGYFALEACFSETVLGLGRIICFDGLQASGKSSLMFELCRIIDAAGGASCIIDTEQKATQDLGPSIVGYDNWPKIKYVSPETFEEALQVITGTVNLLSKAAEKQGKRIPLLIGLDSTGGTVTDAEAEKIDKEGTASRSYAGAALLAAKYLPRITKSLSGMPIVFVGVRHERMVDMGNGIKTPEPKGTAEWSYAAFATFHMQKNGSDIDKVESGGRPILIYLKKGTEPGLRVPVILSWRDETLETETGEIEHRRYMRFDWERAAFDLLTNPEKYKVPQRIIKAFKTVLGPMNAAAGKVSCKPLGLDSPATPEELHQALYHPDNRKVLDRLRAAFCIRVGQEFKYGDDFDEMKLKQQALLLSRREPSREEDVIEIEVESELSE